MKRTITASSEEELETKIDAAIREAMTDMYHHHVCKYTILYDTPSTRYARISAIMATRTDAKEYFDACIPFDPDSSTQVTDKSDDVNTVQDTSTANDSAEESTVAIPIEQTSIQLSGTTELHTEMQQPLQDNIPDPDNASPEAAPENPPPSSSSSQSFVSLDQQYATNCKYESYSLVMKRLDTFNKSVEETSLRIYPLSAADIQYAQRLFARTSRTPHEAVYCVTSIDSDTYRPVSKVSSKNITIYIPNGEKQTISFKNVRSVGIVDDVAWIFLR